MLQDFDSTIAVDPIQADQAIRNQYRAMEARLPAAWSYTASAGTITAGSATFTLPTTSSAEYAGALMIQLVSDGTFLEKLTQQEMMQLRRGGTSSGRPNSYSPYEDSTQSVICWVHPVPTATETYNLFRSLIAADTSSTDVASTTLPIGRIAQDALVHKTASVLMKHPGYLKKVDPELRQIALGQARDWDGEAERLIYQEASRRMDIETAGRIQRFQA